MAMPTLIAPSGGDDTISVRDAVTSGANIVLFQPGVYTVTEGIAIPSHVSLVGLGATVCFAGPMVDVDEDPQSRTAQIFLVDGSSDVMITGFTFVGSLQPAVDGSAGVGVRCRGGENVDISHNSFSDFTKAAVWLNGTKSTRVVYNRISDILPNPGPKAVKRGIAGVLADHSCDDAFIGFNRIRRVGSRANETHGQGILFRSSPPNSIAQRVTVVGNIVKETQLHGIVMYYNGPNTLSSGSTICDNNITGTGHAKQTQNECETNPAPILEERGNGIYLLAVIGVAVLDNKVDRTNVRTAKSTNGILQGGIVVAAIAPPGDYEDISEDQVTAGPITISKNNVRATSGFPSINIQFVRGCDVLENVIELARADGIKLRGCSSLVVVGNSIEGTAGIGVNFEPIPGNWSGVVNSNTVLGMTDDIKPSTAQPSTVVASNNTYVP